MKLKELSLLDCEQAREWRNEILEMLRTPFMLTEEMQAEFYHNVVCNRSTNARFWGVWEDGKIKTTHYFDTTPAFDTESDGITFAGMVGLENISWENRNAEISIILNPDYSDQYDDALKLLLDEGFLNMNLENIYTEVYSCSPYCNFWLSQHAKYNGGSPLIVMPNRKFYKGVYFNSFYININKERYNESSSA